MSPRTQFDRNTIVNAALEIAKKKGLSGITARSVADKIHSSVAPIYVNFKTIEDLISEVVKRVFELSEQILSEQEGKTMFERIGKASIRFARTYPILFRDLSINPNPYMASYESIENRLIQSLDNDETMSDLSLEEKKRLLLKMRIFQMGLSVMVANKHVPSGLSDQDIDNILLEVGKDLLMALRMR